MTTITVMALFAIFVLGSMTYVYRFRGTARYANFSEYMRKSWPIFAPLNCLLYLTTPRRAKRPILDVNEFPELKVLQENWREIRDEALALHRQQGLEAASSPDSPGYYDIGFRTFYRSGWRKFYLRWYGYTHASAKRLCPNTLRLLEKTPSINGAMFAVLPPGGELTRHADPVACSLRYHLGLVTPNSDLCHINIDNIHYSWRDGQALLFDETYLHYARNDADTDRIILMCDVNRPTYIVGSIVNWFYKGLMRATVVPNTEEDQRGLANRLFQSLTPVVGNVRELKQTQPGVYKLIKYTVNTILLLLILGILAGIVYLVSLLF